MADSIRNRPFLSKRASHPSMDGCQSGRTSPAPSSLNEPPTWPDLRMIPGWGGPHTDFAKCPEMGILPGLSIVLVGKTSQKPLGGSNDVVRKGEARSLSGKSLGEGPQFVVGPASGSFQWDTVDSTVAWPCMARLFSGKGERIRNPFRSSRNPA